jgi:hypothetical protein
MRYGLCLIPVLLLSACVGEPEQAAPQPPPPPPVAAPRPVAVATPAPLAENWMDWPLTPGNWVHRKDARGAVALYGQAGADALFIARCDRGAGQIYLSRSGTIGNGAVMTLRATSGLKAFPALPAGDTPPYAAARLAPREPQLDAIAFSRGRFLVSVTGLPDAVIPSWPEFARVVEECRG